MSKDGHHLIKNQAEIISLTSEGKKQEPFFKRILIVDNEPDIIQTFKSALEQEYNNNKKT
jgi:PleD family two-component response regulator